MGKAQRDKGKRGERMLASLLRELGYEARRAQQFQGDVSDVNSADIIHDIPGVFIECKFGYNDFDLSCSGVKKWVETATENCPSDRQWIIFWKPDRKPWRLITKLDDILIETLDVQSLINKVSRFTAQTSQADESNNNTSL